MHPMLTQSKIGALHIVRWRVCCMVMMEWFMRGLMVLVAGLGVLMGMVVVVGWKPRMPGFSTASAQISPSSVNAAYCLSMQPTVCQWTILSVNAAYRLSIQHIVCQYSISSVNTARRAQHVTLSHLSGNFISM